MCDVRNSTDSLSAIGNFDQSKSKIKDFGTLKFCSTRNFLSYAACSLAAATGDFGKQIILCPIQSVFYLMITLRVIYYEDILIFFGISYFH